MALITPRTFRGTRDFLPSELLGRRRILETIEEAYRRYGFQPLETPAIEYLDILTGKSEENDKLIYEIKRARGGAEETSESAIALRYDLTVPTARVVAQYSSELPRPFKRYQIQPVWRADRPQPKQGRFREFVQCDADIIGTSSLLADAEIVALTYEVLRDLGFVDERKKPTFQIRLSSRKFLRGMVEYVSRRMTGRDRDELFFHICRAIDKLDKIGRDGVINELDCLGLPGAEIWGEMKIFEKVFRSRDFFKRTDRWNNSLVEQGIHEIHSVYVAAVAFGVPRTCLKCDPFLARGLDYYTGPIFESVSKELPHLGSLSGGGRYDNLVSTFSKERVSATGTTLGLDRIQTALQQLKKMPAIRSTTEVFLAVPEDDIWRTHSLQLAWKLRKKGLHVEVWFDRANLKKQIGYANKQRIPVIVIFPRQVGTVERLGEEPQLMIRDLRDGSQVACSFDHQEVIRKAKAFLGQRKDWVELYGAERGDF